MTIAGFYNSIWGWFNMSSLNWAIKGRGIYERNGLVYVALNKSGHDVAGQARGSVLFWQFKDGLSAKQH